ncbi:MAG TPA: hypothetical protein VF595_01070 [Tepidisphaeraceae bacterium]|jgi:hypothetical protein
MELVNLKKGDRVGIYNCGTTPSTIIGRVTAAGPKQVNIQTGDVHSSFDIHTGKCKGHEHLILVDYRDTAEYKLRQEQEKAAQQAHEEALSQAAALHATWQRELVVKIRESATVEEALGMFQKATRSREFD